MALFTAAELSSYLRYEVDASSAETAERAASGWLLARLGLPTWPTWPVDDTGTPIVPEQLWALAVELGAIIHENPTSLTSEGTGQATTSWWRRRQEIGDEVRAWARNAGLPVVADEATIPLPRGSFPMAMPWPDPATVYPRRDLGWPWRDRY